MMVSMINKLGKHRLGILFAGCAAALICTPAHAGTILSIQPASLLSVPGGTGSFDVVLTNSGPSGISVAGFAFEISAGAGVTFTSADFSTGATPYIFAGDSFDQMDTPPDKLYTSLSPLKASDLANNGAGITLLSGASFALGDVLFAVSPTASAGPVAISFTGGSNFNNLSDPNGQGIAVGTLTGGTITIGSSTVPEPSSILLTMAGAGALAGWTRRKRRAA